MAHGITERDGLFVVRAPSWHGLETAVFEDYPTREQAQAIAHPWEPISEPVYRRVPVIRLHTCTPDCEQPCDLMDDITTEYEEVEGFKLNVRSDTSDPLGVVSDTFEPVKNAEMYDIAEAIEGEAKGSVMFETGGSLKGGRKVWLLIRLRDPLVLRGDQITATIPYYALQNSHDGSGSFRGQATMTRIVCDNTAQMADLDAQQRGTEFVFRHTRNVKGRIEEAKEALSGWRESVDAYRRLNDHLLTLKLEAQDVRDFVDQFIPMPKAHTSSERVIRNVEQAQTDWYSILLSETCEGVSNTAYGLVQASVEYLNHARKARSNETRFKRAYLDRDRLVSDAVQLALEVAR